MGKPGSSPWGPGFARSVLAYKPGEEGSMATTRTEMAQALEAVGATVCGYTPPGKPLASHCDCKYGRAPGVTGCERTGCPELREMRMLLEAMTETEWQRIQKRLQRKTQDAWRKERFEVKRAQQGTRRP